MAGLFITLAPVLLGTVLALADKMRAPLWVILGLTAASGVGALAVATRDHLMAARPTAGLRAPGRLEITAIKVKRLPGDPLYELDFRVSNTGGSTVSVHALTLRVERAEVEAVHWGVEEVTAHYEMDISGLREGGSASADLAQRIEPGDSDRFVVRVLHSTSFLYTTFALRPTLATNFGPVLGPLVALIGRE
ncbi:hypothetical protein D7223_12190 [Micromonospora endolithica]|uniref:Uncharacterized protein n=1 Tax=Micromonospora endolithica TaxID=230091 RepID=A0A3A9ZHF2_9ACTN|nr:hypothetical protein D7223_12190 [Micromonospora endolithica]